MRANALEHAAAIREARARLVVFPELSLTGYELEAERVSLDDPALEPIVAACAETGTVALAGAAVQAHIAMLRIDAAGAAVVYRKCHLGGGEAARFSPGEGPAAIELDGVRVGLGICRDTGEERHVAATAALGIDLYAAGLVHRPDELEEQERRAVRIARACRAPVAFASFAGRAGGGYDETAGGSAIWAADGTPLVRACRAPGAFARSLLAWT